MERDLSLYVVAPTDTIRVAMEKIDRNKHRAVVVVEDGKVIGTLSDGDVRRAFLHEAMAIAPVAHFMQLNPQVTTETDPARRAEIIKQQRVTLLPVVSDDYRLIDIELAYEPAFESDD